MELWIKTSAGSMKQFGKMEKHDDDDEKRFF